MSRRSRIVATFGVVGGAALGVALAVHASPPPSTSPTTTVSRATAVNLNRTPVLVELFTSEGCSSCPPADAVLADLDRSQPVAGAYVVALAHHVDYWNSLGWPDPFSSAAATTRQHSYATTFGEGTYTPQAIVDGAAQGVGSRSSFLHDAIAEAAKRPHAPVALRVVRDAHGELDVTATVGALPTDAGPDAELLVAVVQIGARVVVSKGENAGKTLEHSAVVRELRVLGSVPKTGAVHSSHVLLPPAKRPGTNEHFEIVAFVQERQSRHVLGSSRAET